MAWSSAWRSTGSPSRCSRRLSQAPGSASSSRPVRTKRPVSIRPQVEALTRSEPLLAEMARPFAGAQLVADQPVGRLGVGDPEQRLGETHQHDALARAEAVLSQECLHAQLIAAGVPHASGEMERARPDTFPGRVVDRGELEQLGDAGRLVGPMSGADPDPVRVLAEGWPVFEETGGHVPTPRCWTGAPLCWLRKRHSSTTDPGDLSVRVIRSDPAPDDRADCRVDWCVRLIHVLGHARTGSGHPSDRRLPLPWSESQGTVAARTL